jgi:hypothetical protein
MWVLCAIANVTVQYLQGGGQQIIEVELEMPTSSLTYSHIPSDLSSFLFASHLPVTVNS